MLEPIDAATESIATSIVDAALHVHRALGPGLLESVYETCLAHELSKRGIDVQRQVVLPIVYDGVQLESGLRLDMMVGRSVIVEIKAVEVLLPVHKAQVLAYLRLSSFRLGLLINFNVVMIKDGIKRIAL